ncbi:MAG TPA: HoxN/HupN/NixA family nickel/cobalt transporter [Candidatus Limnocylindrales bacterium]
MTSKPPRQRLGAAQAGRPASRLSLRGRILVVYAFLLGLNAVSWGLTLLVARDYPILLATGVLAYSFGLRHGVDADHIAAIDNATRKLMQDGQRPAAAGLFFSLGHSTIVVLLSLAVAISSAVIAQAPTLRAIGGLLGTGISAAFLIGIGLVNLVVLVELARVFGRVTAGGTYDEQTLDEFLAGRGLLSRLLRPLLRLVRHSWQLYPVGVLFGLGFDTATEVALLGLAAAGGAQQLPIWTILLLPALFAAGMTLVDATDGILMLGAYGWAFVKPIRKLYYNLTITLVSVVVAFLIGGLEVLAIVAGQLNLSGGIWDLAGGVDFELMGFLIVGVFAASWILSTIVYRWRGYERLPVTTGPPGGLGGEG